MDILFITTADWDNPYWTNKQHVAQELARLGHRLLYVESLGLRRPTATAKDARRIFKRLGRSLKAPRKVREGLWVYSPVILPAHSSPLAQRLNRVWLNAQIRFWLARLKMKPSLLWTYLPITPLLFDIKDFATRVYHNVDDISAQPGMPRDVIRQAEDTLLDSVDIVFTTSPQLQKRSEARNVNSFYLPNVADFDHFARALAPETEIPEDLAAIPGPRIGFVGAISAYKMDMQLLREVALLRPSMSFVLIGEVGEGDPLTETVALDELPNVHFLGGKSYTSLPNYMKGFDVAMLPSRINDYTVSMFPMKFFEYLAAGLPVVSTPLPALAEYHSVARFSTDAPTFAAALDDAVRGDVADIAARHAVASERTYKARTEKMLDLLVRAV